MLRLSEDQLKTILDRRKKVIAPVVEEPYDLALAISSAIETGNRYSVDSALITSLKLGLKAIRKTDGSPKPYERMEQVIGLVWLACNDRKAYMMTTATPMGGYRPSGAGGQMKGEGAKSGYPDLLIDVPRGGYHGLRIEMKRFDKTANASDDQLRWLNDLATEGYRAILCRGHQALIHSLATYLGIKTPIDADRLPSWAIEVFAPSPHEPRATINSSHGGGLSRPRGLGAR